jgi:hypothetical protein
MTQASQSGSSSTPRLTGAGYLFGVPLGDLGWFTTLLMSLAIGFAAFFAATFCAIFSILFYNTITHHSVDFANSYRFVGLPVGILVLAIAATYLGSLWIRRHLRRS